MVPYLAKLNKFLKPIIRRLIKAALYEDLGLRGDVTSLAIIPSNSRSTGRIITKEKGILCGMEVAMEAFRQQDRRVRLVPKSRDGTSVRRGQTILEIHGKTRAILTAERTALNFVQRLSGIATFTRCFVKNAERGTPNVRPKILDTRKTTPLLRALEKYAVACGGGMNHRFGLYDMVLIKDNHLAALSSRFSNPIREAVQRARKRWPELKIEVECNTLHQVQEAVEAGADIILLDNMNLSQLRRAVKMINGRARTEASGNVNLKTIAAIARTRVNFISVGSLTHSVPSLDFSLEIPRPSHRKRKAP